MATTAQDLGLDQLTLRGPADTAKLRDAITDPPLITRTIDGASTLEVTVSDYTRALLRSGIFDGRSYAVVDGMHFELVAISKTGDRTKLTFEDAIVAALRRETSPLSVPAGSTTRAEFARRLAKEADVAVATDPTKRPNVRHALTRSAHGDQKSDSWTVLGDAAEEIHWRRFSDGRQLMFGSDEWLMSLTAPLKVREHHGPVHDIDFDLDVGKKASEATVAVDAQRWAIRPGQAVELVDCGPGDGNWLASEFTRTLTQSRASMKLVRARHVLKEPPPPATGRKGEAGKKGFAPMATGSTAGVAANPARERMVRWALAQAGKAYVWGASGPNAFDCSGLVQEATRAAGKVLTKPSGSQYAALAHAGRTCSVQTALATRGALLFAGPGGDEHVAISLGNNSTIEAMGTAYGVLVAGNASSRPWTCAGVWL